MLSYSTLNLKNKTTIGNETSNPQQIPPLSTKAKHSYKKSEILISEPCDLEDYAQIDSTKNQIFEERLKTNENIFDSMTDFGYLKTEASKTNRSNISNMELTLIPEDNKETNPKKDSVLENLATLDENKQEVQKNDNKIVVETRLGKTKCRILIDIYYIFYF